MTTIEAGINTATRSWIPEEVLGSYELEPDRIMRLGGGLINSTFLVFHQDSRSIVQKLSPALDTRVIEDADVYTRHLAAAGWEAPLLIRTSEGSTHSQDDAGNTWRQLAYIESEDGDFTIPTEAFWSKAADMLGRWHGDIATLSYEPTFSIPHFHDTDYYADSLSKNLPGLPDAASKRLGRRILDAYEALSPLPVSPPQLLHGDPKLANMLVRDGSPFTLIDLDTVMHGPVWLDIGDMARSALSANHAAGRRGSSKLMRRLSEGYYRATQPDMEFADFHAGAKSATQRLALELGMRYLNDIVDADYFAWDHRRYSSRQENHLARASSMLLTHSLLSIHNEKEN